MDTVIPEVVTGMEIVPRKSVPSIYAEAPEARPEAIVIPDGKNIATRDKALKRGFTERRLKDWMADPPASGAAHYYDAVPGLAFKVLPNGAGSFVFIKRIKTTGRILRVRLGGVGEISIDHAKRKAATLNKQIADGLDPRDVQRKVEAAGRTFGDLCARYIELHAKPHKRSWRRDEAVIAKYLEPLRNRPLLDINSDDIRTLHIDIGGTQDEPKFPVQANRLLVLLGTIFRAAGDWWPKDRKIPTAGIQRYPESTRGRLLETHEFQKLFGALDTEPSDQTRDLVRLLLFTAQRRGTVEAMRWDELNLETATWHIPGRKMKAGRAHAVPLVPAVMEIIERRRQSVGDNQPWVFPSRGETGHLIGIESSWKSLKRRAGLRNLHIHDLRRAIASVLGNDTGAGLPIVAKLLGHKISAARGGVTMIYDRATDEAVRRHLELAVAHVLQVVAEGGAK